MKLNLYKENDIQNEHVDVYYSNMRPLIRQLVDTVNSDRPSLSGRPADEDLDDGEEILLDPKDIYYLDHIDRKLFAYTKNGVYRLMNTLSACEEMLWNYGFVRVSKSNLINIYRIKQLKPDLNMKVYMHQQKLQEELQRISFEDEGDKLMREKIGSFLIELCCVYTIISVAGAIVNIICKTETNNLNVIVMFITCLAATFVLFLHKLFDNVSPLVMIIAQFLIACAVVGLILLIISVTISPISPKGWFEFYRSFVIPYIVFAAFYYYRVFSETKKQDELIRQIQEKAGEKAE